MPRQRAAQRSNRSDFWAAEQRIIGKVHDVRVSALSNAHGPASITFKMNSLVIVESDLSTNHYLGDVAPIDAAYRANTICFIPKNTRLTCNPSTPFNVTTVEIPDHWF